jgi:sodium/potassium-transporting ATPase subunit alpha
MAQPAFFVSVGVIQCVNLISSKTRVSSIFTVGVFNNRHVLYAIASNLIIASLLVYVPVFNSVVLTRPLLFVHWLPVLPFCLSFFLVDEQRRLIIRHHRRWNQGRPGWFERTLMN